MQLAPDDRPSVDAFERILAPVIEMILINLWDDSSYVTVVDEANDVRVATTMTVPPHAFPPCAYFAQRVDDETILLLSLSFDWEFWDRP